MKIISSIKKGVLKVVATTLFAAVLMAAAQTSSANTGAGTTILNVVTVNYQSPGGIALVASASASVTVTLVPTAVTLAAVGATANATPSGTTTTYTFTATSNANGSDTYLLNSTAGALANATVTSVVFNQGGAPVTSLTLASSVISNVTALDTIVIPAGTATNLVAGDIVIINLVDYKVSTVSVVSNPASAVVGPQAAVITNETPVSVLLVANAAGSGTLPAFVIGDVGLLVAEQQAFTVDVLSSTVAPGNGTVPIDITVGGPAPGTPVTPAIPTITTVQGANLSITKEVSSDAGVTFAPNGSAAPGAPLIYRITITNGGAGSASSLVITDPMPAYTTYTANSASTATAVGALPLGGVPLPAVGVGTLTDIVDILVDGYDFGLTTPNQATFTVPTVAADATVVLFYQVTIQ